MFTAREEITTAGRFTPLAFARSFVAHDGVQRPGREADHPAQDDLAAALLEALRRDRPAATEPDLVRELRRARDEAAWAAAATSTRVVGFRVTLEATAAQHTECQATLQADHGLGGGVIRKADVIVLQPACGAPRCTPVLVDEVEQ